MSELPRPEAVTDADIYIDAWERSRQAFLALCDTRQDTFQTRPADGSWSPAEIAEHLQLTQFFYARSIPICLSGKLGYDMHGADSVNHDRIFGRVARAQGIQNPPRVTPEKNWDLQTARKKLDQSHASMRKNLEAAEIEALRGRGYDHPLHGPASLLDWLWLLTLHEAAHLEAMAAKS
jgi:hypothetical protein